MFKVTVTFGINRGIEQRERGPASKRGGEATGARAGKRKFPQVHPAFALPAIHRGSGFIGGKRRFQGNFDRRRNLRAPSRLRPGGRSGGSSGSAPSAP